MLLAEGLTWIEWTLLATAVVCAMLVMRHAFSGLAWQPKEQDGAASDAAASVETTAARRVANLEVRLYDFAREVEARLEKRAVELDTLVAAADREIIRLRELVNVAPSTRDARGPDLTRFRPTGSLPPVTEDSNAKTSESAADLTAAQAEMVLYLHEAGYTVPEIAHVVGRPATAVESAMRAA